MQKKSTFLFSKALHISPSEILISWATPITGGAFPIVTLAYNTLVEAVTGLMSTFAHTILPADKS